MRTGRNKSFLCVSFFHAPRATCCALRAPSYALFRRFDGPQVVECPFCAERAEWAGIS